MADPEIPGGLRLAADIGGTFTDIAAFDPATGALKLGKALSTPSHLVDGVAAGVERAGVAFSDAALFLHGSTIAINTMLERTGARAALVITKGFRDIYEIGRINRPDSYNLFFKKHRPLIERAMCFEIDERMLAEGDPLKLRSTRMRSVRSDKNSPGSMSRPSRSCCCTATAIRTTRSGRRMSCRNVCRPRSSPPPTSSRRNTVSSSAALRSPRTPISDRGCAATSMRSAPISKPNRFPARSWSCSRPADSTTWRRRGTIASTCSNPGPPPESSRVARSPAPWGSRTRSPSTWAAPRPSPASSTAARP